MILPPRLKVGDTICCIAPARNATLPWVQSICSTASDRLRREGFEPTFGMHIEEQSSNHSSPLLTRLYDLHSAFRDSTVKAVLSLIGGYNSNQLLRHIDYDLIASNPKILCGYSDITALTHAIYTRTKLVTYSGPHFFNFGDLRGADYTVRLFRSCVMSSKPFIIDPSTCWSSDLWAQDQHNRSFVQNDGPVALQKGEAEGVSLGGHLSTFMNLAGSSFWPGLNNAVLFIEGDNQISPNAFDALLESLTQQTDFDGLRALLIGRFHPASNIDLNLLKEIIRRKNALAHLPIIANLDFGHTNPIFTFPVGGKVKILADLDSPMLVLIDH